MEVPRLPKFDYYLDESDPDIVVLRRQDGASWQPSAPGVSSGRVLWRPPRRTTGPCSRSTQLPVSRRPSSRWALRGRAVELRRTSLPLTWVNKARSG
jgi:hypothetical protein